MKTPDEMLDFIEANATRFHVNNAGIHSVEFIDPNDGNEYWASGRNIREAIVNAMNDIRDKE